VFLESLEFRLLLMFNLANGGKVLSLKEEYLTYSRSDEMVNLIMKIN
jgi:hypothetical protein